MGSNLSTYPEEHATLHQNGDLPADCQVISCEGSSDDSFILLSLSDISSSRRYHRSINGTDCKQKQNGAPAKNAPQTSTFGEFEVLEYNFKTR